MKRYKLNSILISTAIFFTAIAFPLCTKAQNNVREILIGEKVPDVQIKEILNYKSSSAKLSDFQGKLLILDFWATYCAPCIGMFPKTDSLQKRFKGQVEFLPVTKEPKAKVAAFLNHMALIRGFKPMSVVNDKAFSDLFIYSGIPYYVWIDAAGKVVATTGSDEITEQNILAVLSGKSSSFENRKDIRNIKIDIAHKPLFLLSDNYELKDSTQKRDELPLDNIFSYSIATKYIPNANGQCMFDTTRFAAYNVSVDYLYRWFYSTGFYDHPVFNAFIPPTTYRFDINGNQLMSKITVSKSIKPGSRAMLDWAKQNAVSYEIVFPKGITWKEKMNLVKSDLDKYFAKPMGFDTHVEKKINVKTAELTIINRSLLPISKGGNQEGHDDSYSYSQHNYPIKQLISVLNGKYFFSQKITIVNNTDLDKNLDIDLVCDMTDLKAINEQLEKFGLMFKLGTNQIDVLVFTQTKQ